MAVDSLHSSSASRSEAVGSDQPLWTPLALGALGVGLLLTLILYGDVLQWMWGVWHSSPDYSHGVLIPLVSLFVLWVRRDRLTEVRQRRQVREPAKNRRLVVVGVIALFAGLAMRLLGIFSSVLTLEGLSLIPFLFGVVAISVGWDLARWAAPALLYLVFMVPLPGFLAGQLSGLLQTIATKISVFALQTVGVPAVANGNIIHLWQGTIGVAEACSGLRMLYAFVALCVGACLIMEKTWLERALIMASAVPIAIAVNCFRITATGLAYEYSDSETAEHIFHDLAGWLMVPIGFVMLMAVIEVLRRLIMTDEREAAMGV